MDEWFLNRLTDYWDNREQNSIAIYSQQLGKCTPKEKSEAEDAIRAAIAKHVSVLTDEQLLNAAFIITDDIYKSVNGMSSYNDLVTDYLTASVGTFFQLFHERGYALHYLTNNTFTDWKMPIFILGRIFVPAGMVYICPQQIAQMLMKHDQITLTDYFDHLPRYIQEAEGIAEEVLERCHAQGESYFYLYVDGETENFNTAIEEIGEEGVLTVFREEAPVAGTSCLVYSPKGFD